MRIQKKYLKIKKVATVSFTNTSHSFLTTQTERSVWVSLVWVKTRWKESRDYKLEADYTHSSTKHTQRALILFTQWRLNVQGNTLCIVYNCLWFSLLTSKTGRAVVQGSKARLLPRCPPISCFVWLWECKRIKKSKGRLLPEPMRQKGSTSSDSFPAFYLCLNGFCQLVSIYLNSYTVKGF